jgi:excisionase family DNA binding protein
MATMRPMSDEMVTAQRAAELLGIGVRTFERYAAEGRIVTYRLPKGHRRFLRSDVLGLLLAVPAAS